MCAIATVVMSSLSLVPASASEHVQPSASEGSYNLEVLADKALAIDELDESVSAFTVSTDDVTVEVPKSSDDMILVAEAGEEGLGISLPYSEQTGDARIGEFGEIAYHHKNSSSTSVLPYDDGSVQLVTTIEDVSAPIEYAYDLDVPDGATFEFLEGSAVAILDKEGKFFAGVAAPWAKDANGADVPTRYEVRDSTLVQVVDHRRAGISYPVTADPWLGRNFFSSLREDTYHGNVRYSGTVSGWGATVMLAPQGRDIMLAYGWPEWTGKYPILTTRPTFHQQFTCHVVAGTFGLPFTGEYNLEGFRPSKPDWRNSVLIHRCNW